MRQVADRVRRVYSPTLQSRGVVLTVTLDPGAAEASADRLYPAIAAAMNALGQAPAVPAGAEPPQIDVHLRVHAGRVVVRVVGVGLVEAGATAPEHAVGQLLLEQVLQDVGGRATRTDAAGEGRGVNVTLSCPAAAPGAGAPADADPGLRLAA